MVDEGIKERFVIIRNQTGLNVKNFASTLDMAPTTVSSIESGTREPSKDVLIKLAATYNVNLHWMLTGEGDPYTLHSPGIPKAFNKIVTRGISTPESDQTSDISCITEQFSLFRFQRGKPIPVETDENDQDAVSLIPLFGQTAAAGSGQEPNQLAEVEAYIPIVFEMLGGASPRNCGLIRVVGDSMTDMSLFNGDLVIFDQSQMEGDGVFVISIGDAVRIKRLEYRQFEQKVIISSENAKRYPNPEVISFEQAEALLRVHGKVICWMHRHPY